MRRLTKARSAEDELVLNEINATQCMRHTHTHTRRPPQHDEAGSCTFMQTWTTRVQCAVLYCGNAGFNEWAEANSIVVIYPVIHEKGWGKAPQVLPISSDLTTIPIGSKPIVLNRNLSQNKQLAVRPIVPGHEPYDRLIWDGGHGRKGVGDVPPPLPVRARVFEATGRPAWQRDVRYSEPDT